MNSFALHNLIDMLNEFPNHVKDLKYFDRYFQNLRIMQVYEIKHMQFMSRLQIKMEVSSTNVKLNKYLLIVYLLGSNMIFYDILLINLRDLSISFKK